MKLKKILLIIIGIILSLLILEASLRLTSWIAQSSLSKRIFGNDAKLRILCVGDSYTYGLGVERQEAYPAQLEVLLKGKFGNNAAEVINAGRPGINTPILANCFQEMLDDYRPDIVLVMIGTNDEWNFGEFFSVSDTVKDKINSFLCSLRISRMFKILTTSFKKPQEMNYSTVKVDKSKISEMLRLLEENGGLNNAYYYQAIMLGNECRDRNKFDEAKLYYDFAIKIKPDSFLITKELLVYYKNFLTVLKNEIEKDKINAILRFIEKNGGLDDEYYYRAIKLGNYYRNNNKFDEAKLFYDCAFKIKPDDFLIFRELLRYHKRYLSVLNDDLDNDLSEENTENIRNYICSVYFSKEIKDQSDEFALEVIDFSKIYRILLLFEDNVLFLLKTIQLYGFNAEIWAELDELFIAWSYPEHAIRCYQYLSRNYPDNIDVYLRLAAQYKRVRDYSKARKYYKTVLELDVGNQQASDGMIAADYFIDLGLTENYVSVENESAVYAAIDSISKRRKSSLSSNSDGSVEDEYDEVIEEKIKKDGNTSSLVGEQGLYNSVRDLNFALGVYINEGRFDERIEKILNKDKNYKKLFDNISVDQETFSVKRSTRINNIALVRLKEICNLAKARKIKLVFLSYPLHVSERVLKVAKEAKVPFIDFRASFKSVITPNNLNAYFLPDGHCTKKGYGIVADKAAEVLISEL